MYRKLLKAKIHRAVVTEADLHYEGSLTIDKNLLDATGICEHEMVQVVDIDNGACLETYALIGEAGLGEIKANGAAARLIHPGDRIIIMTYGYVPEPELADWSPSIVLVNEDNSIKEIL
ncbi:MAG: aspartate 1-decarboxylase [Anaerolineae bacterium]|jgi:aspartate 1-decarboxylase|nr:aspartate 1-decarboxylase [Anaerolineae bacterium]MBT7074167.1 aspartate 1-decarboxylase [Anaerolineae bacterium]MBT7783017.1 aspartate 1-decarboxylase [Anaerolineae bacterium]